VDLFVGRSSGTNCGAERRVTQYHHDIKYDYFYEKKLDFKKKDVMVLQNVR
jgi:hypothetical protein